MKTSDYQHWVRSKMKNHANGNDALCDYALGLCGEAGEAVEIVKKAVFHDHHLGLTKMIEELGDCVWYITALCNAMNVSLDKVLEINQAKLNRRYPNGYEHARSKGRSEIKPQDLEHVCPHCFYYVDSNHCANCGAERQGNHGWVRSLEREQK